MQLRRTSVALVAALALAASIHAQAPYPKVFIGDGVTSRGTYNGKNHQPFQDALNDLAATGAGWQIEVLPGDYRFKEKVIVQTPGVRLYGSRAVVIGPDPTLAEPLFEVQAGATGFALDGLTFEETRTAFTSTDLLQVQASDVAIRGCSFRVEDGADGTGVLLKLDGAAAPIRGALVLGCSFLFEDVFGGRVGLQATRCDELRVLANEFRPRVGAGPALLHAAIELDQSPDATVRANVFTALTSPGGGAEDAILVAKTAASRLALTGNVFGDVSGTSIVVLAGVDGCTVQGNVFGRESVVSAVVRLDGGEGNAVTGNQFHDLGTGSAPSVRAVANEALVVAANTFLDSRHYQVRLDGVQGANVFGNRFADAPGLPINIAAIEVESSCTQVVVGANAVHGPAWIQVYTGPATAFLNLL